MWFAYKMLPFRSRNASAPQSASIDTVLPLYTEKNMNAIDKAVDLLYHYSSMLQEVIYGSD